MKNFNKKLISIEVVVAFGLVLAVFFQNCSGFKGKNLKKSLEEGQGVSMFNGAGLTGVLNTKVEHVFKETDSYMSGLSQVMSVHMNSGLLVGAISLLETNSWDLNVGVIAKYDSQVATLNAFNNSNTREDEYFGLPMADDLGYLKSNLGKGGWNINLGTLVWFFPETKDCSKYQKYGENIKSWTDFSNDFYIPYCNLDLNHVAGDIFSYPVAFIDPDGISHSFTHFTKGKEKIDVAHLRTLTPGIGAWFQTEMWDDSAKFKLSYSRECVKKVENVSTGQGTKELVYYRCGRPANIIVTDVVEGVKWNLESVSRNKAFVPGVNDHFNSFEIWKTNKITGAFGSVIVKNDGKKISQIIDVQNRIIQFDYQGGEYLKSLTFLKDNVTINHINFDYYENGFLKRIIYANNSFYEFSYNSRLLQKVKFPTGGYETYSYEKQWYFDVGSYLAFIEPSAGCLLANPTPSQALYCNLYLFQGARARFEVKSKTVVASENESYTYTYEWQKSGSSKSVVNIKNLNPDTIIGAKPWSKVVLPDNSEEKQFYYTGLEDTFNPNAASIYNKLINRAGRVFKTETYDSNKKLIFSKQYIWKFWDNENWVKRVSMYPFLLDWPYQLIYPAAEVSYLYSSDGNVYTSALYREVNEHGLDFKVNVHDYVNGRWPFEETYSWTNYTAQVDLPNSSYFGSLLKSVSNHYMTNACGKVVPTKTIIARGNEQLVDEFFYGQDTLAEIQIASVNNQNLKNCVLSEKRSSFNGKTKKNHFYYDEAGNLIKTVDGMGRESLIVYDPSYDPTYTFYRKTINPKGHVTIYSWNKNINKLSSETDSNGSVVTYKYENPLKMVSEITLPNGAGQNFTYDFSTSGSIKVSSISDGLIVGDRRRGAGFSYTHTYDGIGRNNLSKLETSEGLVLYQNKKFNYNNKSSFTSVSSFSPIEKYGTINYVDELGRVKRIKNSKGTQIDYEYDGNSVTLINSEGICIKEWTNALGQKIKKVENDPKGEFVTTYAYDIQGNITKVEQRLSGGPLQTRTYKYNIFGIEEEFQPETGRILYSYYPNGLLHIKILNSGKYTTLNYDSLDRVTSISYSDGTPNDYFSYDSAINGIGKLYLAENANSKTTYNEYDSIGNVISLSEEIKNNGPNFSHLLEYYANGQLKKVNYFNGAVVLNYDSNSIGKLTKFELTGTIANKIILNDIEYDASLFPKKLKLGNAYDINYTYDSYGKMHGIAIPAINYTLNYNYNNAQGSHTSQVYSIKDSATGDQFFNYDTRNRIVKFQDQAKTTNYVYDEFTNLISEDEISFNVNKANNRISGLNYDGDGNLINYDGYKFSYNAKNQLTQVELPSGKVEKYFYNTNGQRVRKEFDGSNYYFNYLSNGDNLVEGERLVTDPGKVNFKINLHAMGQRLASYDLANQKWIYYVNDMHFNPRLVLNDTVQVEKNTKFGPYMAETMNQTVDTELGFNGHLSDKNSNLIYMMGRYYSPTLKRFINTDPVHNNENLFTYTLGNPINYIDADGNQPKNTITVTRVLNAIGQAVASRAKQIGNGLLDTAKAVGRYADGLGGAAFGRDSAYTTMYNGLLEDGLLPDQAAMIVNNRIAEDSFTVATVAVSLGGGPAGSTGSGMGSMPKLSDWARNTMGRTKVDDGVKLLVEASKGAAVQEYKLIAGKTFIEVPIPGVAGQAKAVFQGMSPSGAFRFKIGNTFKDAMTTDGFKNVMLP